METRPGRTLWVLPARRDPCEDGERINDHHETTGFYRKKLPHWLVADGVYFVTISAHGAIPHDAAESIRQESRRLQVVSWKRAAGSKTTHFAQGGHLGIDLIDPKPERFWADEWFDHWVRSSEHGERIIEYIRQNPAKAGLAKQYQAWPHGSWDLNRPE